MSVTKVQKSFTSGIIHNMKRLMTNKKFQICNYKRTIFYVLWLHNDSWIFLLSTENSSPKKQTRSKADPPSDE